jgi:hypothetical protein
MIISTVKYILTAMMRVFANFIRLLAFDWSNI